MKFDTRSAWGFWKAKGLKSFVLGIIDCLPYNGFWRKFAFLLRKPVKNGKQVVYDREIWGLRLRLAARGNLTEQRWLTMPGFHDRQEREALANALGPNSVFLDVGANAGFYLFWALSKKHEDLRIIAVEPNDVMLERIRHNLSENGLSDSVVLFPCAVTPTPCDVVIEQHSENIGQTVVRSEGEGIKVEGRPLLDLLNEAKILKVDAMKIDIEGYEVPVLDAFFKTAPKSLWPRFVIGEIVGDNGAALKGLLCSKGYKIESCTKMNGIFVLSD